jgi:hypothetical protein
MTRPRIGGTHDDKFAINRESHRPECFDYEESRDQAMRRCGYQDRTQCGCRLQSAALDAVAASMQARPMQVALAWLLHRARNILLIPGTSSLKHLHENLCDATASSRKHRRPGLNRGRPQSRPIRTELRSRKDFVAAPLGSPEIRLRAVDGRRAASLNDASCD